MMRGPTSFAFPPNAGDTNAHTWYMVTGSAKAKPIMIAILRLMVKAPYTWGTYSDFTCKYVRTGATRSEMTCFARNQPMIDPSAIAPTDLMSRCRSSSRCSMNVMYFGSGRLNWGRAGDATDM